MLGIVLYPTIMRWFQVFGTIIIWLIDMTNLDLVHASSSHVVVNPQTLKGRMTWRWRENGHPISQTLTPRFGDG